jgi:hypothetical protein
MIMLVFKTDNLKMKFIYILEIILLAFAVLYGYSCSQNVRGKEIYVNEAEGLSGYTVYVRDAEPPPVYTYNIREPQKKEFVKLLGPDDKKDKKTESISPLYYYRSLNPNRLTRIRLRRF